MTNLGTYDMPGSKVNTNATVTAGPIANRYLVRVRRQIFGPTRRVAIVIPDFGLEYLLDLRLRHANLDQHEHRRPNPMRRQQQRHANQDGQQREKMTDDFSGLLHIVRHCNHHSAATNSFLREKEQFGLQVSKLATAKPPRMSD